MVQIKVNNEAVELPKANVEQLEQVLLSVIKRIESNHDSKANC